MRLTSANNERHDSTDAGQEEEEVYWASKKQMGS